MTILDSNIWISFFYDPDSQHERARQLMKEVAKPIVIPEYVFTEVSTVLAQLGDKRLANAFIDSITDNGDVIILPFENNEFDRTIKLFRAYGKKNLSFVDMSLVFLAQTFQVLTFDRKLEKAIAKTTSHPSGT